jgi:RNA 2',3'-cyclic 3'-phosphodiesterase
MIRAFIAIDLPEELRQILAGLAATLQTRLPADSVRWVRPEAIHLTLKFLGDVARELIDDIDRVMQGCASTVEPFDFDVVGLDAFPNPHRPRIVWVGVSDPGGALTSLAQGLDRELASLGIPREGRAFRPHLTLGRVRSGGRSIPDLNAVLQLFDVGHLGKVEATAVSLIQSELRPEGASYAHLRLVRLGQAAGA